MPQSHPTTGPVRFISPVRFLARKTEWRARRNFTSVLFSWSHHATVPYGLTRLCTYGLVEWFAGLPGYSVRCPCGHGTGPARESSMFFTSCETRTGPMRDPQGRRTTPLRTRKGIDATRIDKILHGRPIWPYGARTGALRSPHGLLTGCLG